MYRNLRLDQIAPPVTRWIIIINVLIFAISRLIPAIGEFTYTYFPLYYWKSDLSHPEYQLVTSMFMHGNFMHLLFNMFGIWMFGRTIENVMGQRKYLQFYMLAGLGAGILQLLVFNFEYMRVINAGMSMNPDHLAVIGASGALFGLLAAFGYLFPNSVIYVQFFLPMKAKYFVLLYAGIELFSGFRAAPGDNVAHFAHIGGALIGYLLLRQWRYKPYN